MRKYLFFIAIGSVVMLSCSQRRQVPVAGKWDAYRKAYAFLNSNTDSAFYYFNKLAVNSKDSDQVAIAYNVMAGIQSDAGDYFGAQESSSLSLKFLNEKQVADQGSLANNYNELGLASFHLKHFDEAVNFYNLGLKFAREPKPTAIILNNKANAMLKKGNYSEALQLYREAIALPGITRADFAMMLTNMASAKWLLDPRYNAVPELLHALAIRRGENDIRGENSSYDHLADFYTHTKPDSALFYAGKMMKTAWGTGNPDDRLTALVKLTKTATPQNVQRYFTLYQQLNDSLQAVRSAAKNQFALIRYAAEKTKADFLKLQQDNVQKQYQIAKQNIILYCSVFVFIMVTIGTSFWYRKRKQQAVQDNQLYLSKKVHDVVANGLYRIMQELDNQDRFDKEPIADRLSTLYEQSRDISHERSLLKNDDFPDRIRRLLTAFAGPDTNVAIVGNNDIFWAKTSAMVKDELEQILQEWMVNMKKHSQATSVAVRFALESGQLVIGYTDNGIGFPVKIVYGNGLLNTETRIKLLGGTLTFDTKLQKGVKILLTLPLT